MGTPQGRPQADEPLLQADLVGVGEDHLALLGPQDDALLATNLNRRSECEWPEFL